MLFHESPDLFIWNRCQLFLNECIADLASLGTCIIFQIFF